MVLLLSEKSEKLERILESNQDYVNSYFKMVPLVEFIKVFSEKEI